MKSERKEEQILIIGGTGHYGRYIVRNLLDKGQAVKVLSRNAANACKILGDGVKIVEGDIISRQSVIEALEGVKAIIISVSAFNRKMIRRLRLIERDSVLMVLEEAKKAGVSRIVYISTYDIREDVLRKLSLDWEVPKIKKEIEDALARSEFNWTVLGMSISMEMFHAMTRGETMMVPGGGPPALPNVSPRDAGEIAAQTVLRDDLQGKRIRVTGPEAISFPEAAIRISAATGRSVRFRKIPLLPLRIVSILTKPFNPYLRHLVTSIKLMNNFPQDIVAEVPKDHQRLLDTFDYTPTTIEMDVNRRIQI